MPKSDEGVSVSYWEASEDLVDRPQLTGNEDLDVCVIGGGISGLCTAYFLARDGLNVAVVDDGLIGGGETCRTTAHLSNAIDDRIYRIAEWHGDENANLAVQSHSRAIDEIERIVSLEKIECDFARVDGYLFEAAESEDDLDDELAAAHKCGLTDVSFGDKILFGDHEMPRHLVFPRQGEFHIVRYLRGLVKSIEANGGKLFSKTKIVEWTGGDAPTVTTSHGQEIKARAIVLATNYPIMSKMFAELAPYRTYAIALRIPQDSIEKALYWDTGDPYHYMRVQPENDHDILIVGGEDHRTGQADDAEKRFDALESWVRSRFVQVGEVINTWSGQCLETHDGLAFLGKYSASEPNVYLITGDSGMGMTHGTIGAMIVSDLIRGRENPWTDVYDPSRILTQSLTEAIPEIVSSTKPYVDWVTAGDVESVDEILNGDGAVIRDGLSKIAVYRDDDGILHKHSAVCTHLGCIVRFNSIEKTWDCPCHGSRFSLDGDPVNGPAISPLECLDDTTET